ncbi:MAG: hypothetical protein KDK29_19250 [Sedimentitalea sp.]|nr:hypothetical protein [Sedimentitalea sp.]
MLTQLDRKIEEFQNELRRGEINRLNRFRTWLSTATDIEHDRRIFSAFGKHVGSRGALADLEKALCKLFPPSHELRVELRAAVKDHRHYVDGTPMLIDLMAGPYWLPFLPYRRLDHLSRPEILRLDQWLSWLYENEIQQPLAQHYLRFSEQSASELPLIALQKSFASLDLPKVHSIEIELPKAISLKRHQRTSKNRKPADRCKVDRVSDLPGEWKDAIYGLRAVQSPTGARCPASGFLATVEKVLYDFARSCREQGIAPKFDNECIVSYARKMKQREYRANTRQINLSALNRFRRHVQSDNVNQKLIRGLFGDIRRDERSEVSRLNQKLSRVGSIEATLQKAVELLEKSRHQRSLILRTSYLCAATALALFSLIPLRVSDSNLIWGENVWFEAGRYFIEVETGKTGRIFRGPLCDFLTPFLDALLLNGRADAYLLRAREDAVANFLPVFAKANNDEMSDQRVKNIWYRHLGCGMHVTRARIHTELGKLGAKGVETALILCAQKDQKTAEYYQGRAMHDAHLLISYNALTDDISDCELIEYFPDLDAGA